MPPGANHATEGDAGTSSRSSTRRRNPMACLLCRKRKIKCEFNNGTEVCDHCRSKNTKCTVLSVSQEEALKAWGYTEESLSSLSSADLESLQRQFPQQTPSTAEYTETHLTSARLHQHLGPSSSPHHPLPSIGQEETHLTARLHQGLPSSPHHSLSPTGQDGSENSYCIYDPCNRAAPSSYNNSAHNHHTASRTGSTNPATVPINIPHPQAHAHHQYTNYLSYTSSSPNHQMSYQISATGGAPVSHHAMGDHHQVQQLHPSITVHGNAAQSQNHANYSGQTTNYAFQAAQQPSQGQLTQYQRSAYPATTAPGYTHDGSWGC